MKILTKKSKFVYKSGILVVDNVTTCLKYSLSLNIDRRCVSYMSSGRLFHLECPLIMQVVVCTCE